MSTVGVWEEGFSNFFWQSDIQFNHEERMKKRGEERKNFCIANRFNIVT